MLSQRIAFVGAGNMASAMIGGLVAAGTCEATSLWASDPRADALTALEAKHGIRTTTQNAEAVRESDVVVLSIKPQLFPTVLAELAPALRPNQLVLSIAAGIPIALIERSIGAAKRVVRAMPNTPAMVSAGATAIAAGTHATPEDMAVAEEVFGSVGLVVRVAEEHIDAVTALSGSGPGYVFLLVEALAQAGARAGLPPHTAAALAAQTVYGAGKLLHESGEEPADLRRKVTSPGGTTEAGIASFEAAGLRDIVAAAVAAAKARGAELGAETMRKLGAK